MTLHDIKCSGAGGGGMNAGAAGVLGAGGAGGGLVGEGGLGYSGGTGGGSQVSGGHPSCLYGCGTRGEFLLGGNANTDTYSGSGGGGKLIYFCKNDSI